METGTSFTRLDPAAADRIQTLRRDLGVTSFGLNLMVLGPGQRGRIHRHERQEEVYVVLAGMLTLMLEGEPHDMGPGDAVRVGPEVRRQLVNRTDGRVDVLAMGGSGDHAGRDGLAFADWSDAAGRPVPEVPLPADLPAAELRPAS